MTDTATTHGPGPIIHGPDRNHPGVFVVQLADGTIGSATQADIASIPIAGQWFTGTKNGLIASWPNRAIAEEQANQRGTLLGQIAPVTTTELRRFLDEVDAAVIEPGDGERIFPKFVILVSPIGQPLHGQ